MMGKFSISEKAFKKKVYKAILCLHPEVSQETLKFTRFPLLLKCFCCSRRQVRRDGGIQMVPRRKKNQMVWCKYKVTEAARVSSKLL